MDLYREDVLDHYKNPRNKGELLSGSKEEGMNASCGDRVEFQIDVRDGVIHGVRWNGDGCAISMASSSKLSEWLVKRNVSDVLDEEDRVLASGVIGFEVNKGREKCLVLPVQVVRRLLKSL